LRFDVGLGWDHAHFPGLHPESFQKLAHLRWLAGNPRQGFNPGRGLRNARGWPLPKLGLDRRAVLVEGAARSTRLAVLELLDAAGHIGLQIALEAGLGNATEPWDVMIRDPLTAQV
jgi:hypothetical protein